ncbi:hypothetical protein MD484_g8476, partial [Candolleomyces efflorescens]
MHQGVVNDFTSTAIMTPRQESQLKQQLERTGTKPFMAVTLLDALADSEDSTQHRWSHDLESVIWCLTWYVMLGTPSWQEGTYNKVGGLKRTWTASARIRGIPREHRAGTEHLWIPLTGVALEWNYRQDLVRNGILPYSDKANMELIHSSLPYPKRLDGDEWDRMVLQEEDTKEEDKTIVQAE